MKKRSKDSIVIKKIFMLFGLCIFFVCGLWYTGFRKSSPELFAGRESIKLTGGEGYSKMPSPENKLNINEADARELTAISGIGAKTAEKIVAYREENGEFAAVEDIMNVSGIGEAKFESIKDLITVGSEE